MTGWSTRFDVEADELSAWLRLSLTPGVGNSSARKLLAAFGLPQAIFGQSALALAQTASAAQVVALRTEPAGLANLLERTLAWLQQDVPGGMRRQVATLGDARYPQALLNLDDPPLMLYFLGAAGFKPNQPPALMEQAQAATYSIAHETLAGGFIDPARSLAMVGSRNPTPQGLANARRLAQDMAAAGVTVVSGLALGIDGAAHEGALAGTDRAATLAVVGTGLDRVYPRAHRELAHRIAEHGLLLSEYPLGTPPLMANFPRRNRLIAGLAQGTLVVEAALLSGSLITARLTNEQGKDVFAIPGSIHAVQSRGCHALIKQGAKLVESAQDIFDELKWSEGVRLDTETIAASADGTSATGQFDHDDGVLAALGFDPVGLDALHARTGLDTASLQARLMTLELDGLVTGLPGGLFQRQKT